MIANRILIKAACLVMLMSFWRCAQVVPLSGGAKDTTPPKLLEAIPALNSTGVKPTEIVLRFDEFVKLQDLNSQLIISPALKTPPEITAEGKRVKISLRKEELRENTTYRFYFGKAIADMHELNAVPDFEYVFSTGTHLDSLRLNGFVTEAFNNNRAANVTVGLYRSSTSSDSLVFKESPEYYTKTGPEGEFMFSRLPQVQFNIFAFNDVNRNNVYDGETEKVAFYPKGLIPGKDSIINLKLFQEESPKLFVKRSFSPYYGAGRIVLNKKARVSAEPLNQKWKERYFETKKNEKKDTLSFYVKGISDTLLLAVHYDGRLRTDTVSMLMSKNRNVGQKRFSDILLNQTPGMPMGKTVWRLTFLNWMNINNVRTQGLHVYAKADSLKKDVVIEGKWLDGLTYEMRADLLPGTAYVFKADTFCFVEEEGRGNDSIRIPFKTPAASDFGKVTIKLKVNKKQQYLVQLTNSSGIAVKEKKVFFSLSASNAVSIDFTDVLPGTYEVKMIFDDNDNQIWDSGDVLLKKLPESVFIYSKPLKVLSDWEMEEEIVLKE